MKTSILMTAVLASGSVADVQAIDAKYTTQNGLLDWNQTGATATGIGVGSYTGFSFDIIADHLYNPTPRDDSGSLTTATTLDGKFPVHEPIEEFENGKQLNLTSIDVAGMSSDSFKNVAYVSFVVDGQSITSTSVMTTTTDLTDPWHMDGVSPVLTDTTIASFTFNNVTIDIGTSYDVLFHDASGNVIEVDLISTLNGAHGFHMLTGNGNVVGGGLSAAGLTINTTSVDFGGDDIIPEPSTASLSLLALAGLLARRRRNRV